MLTAVSNHGGLLLLRNAFALRRSRLRARSRCGSDSPPDCHSIPHRRYALLRYPERAKELFAKAEDTAKAKYERLKKLVEFYNV